MKNKLFIIPILIIAFFVSSIFPESSFNIIIFIFLILPIVVGIITIYKARTSNTIEEKHIDRSTFYLGLIFKSILFTIAMYILLIIMIFIIFNDPGMIFIGFFVPIFTTFIYFITQWIVYEISLSKINSIKKSGIGLENNIINLKK